MALICGIARRSLSSVLEIAWFPDPQVSRKEFFSSLMQNDREIMRCWGGSILESCGMGAARDAVFFGSKSLTPPTSPAIQATVASLRTHPQHSRKSRGSSSVF